MTKKKAEGFLIYSFYRFVIINNKIDIKNKLDNFFSKKLVRGTILVSSEGINASISGYENDLNECIRLIKESLNIRKLEIKIHHTNFLPFNRIKVRLKKEIVSLGKGSINVKTNTGKIISAKKWDQVLQDKNTKIIDVRNIFEIEIGKFKNSINPKTDSFREFPAAFKKLKLNFNDKIAMYCTGGIRCEKASAYLREIGYKNVSQLQGGVINYLQNKINTNRINNWKGDCFVFDERVAINKKLAKSKYIQCYGCRRPITTKDTLSKYYKKGVTCPYCYNKRTSEQKKRSLSRQKQISYLEKNGLKNQFKKIISK